MILKIRLPICMHKCILQTVSTVNKYKEAENRDCQIKVFFKFICVRK